MSILIFQVQIIIMIWLGTVILDYDVNLWEEVKEPKNSFFVCLNFDIRYQKDNLGY